VIENHIRDIYTMSETTREEIRTSTWTTSTPSANQTSIATPPPSSNTNQFWNTNLPLHQHTSVCPSFLLYAYSDPKDLRTLSTPDSAFTPQTWQEVTDLIRENRLHDFQRVPSELYRYRRFVEEVGRKWGSVLRFLVEERLEWPVDESGRVVVDDGDEVGWERGLERDGESFSSVLFSIFLPSKSHLLVYGD
jgi:hypothetical protein